MSFVMLESGTYYHHETIHGARLRDRMPRSVYVPDLTEADIAGCSAVLVADRDITFCQMLDHIAIEPGLANTQGVFLLRPSLALQQKRSIDEALDRLLVGEVNRNDRPSRRAVGWWRREDGHGAILVGEILALQLYQQACLQPFFHDPDDIRRLLVVGREGY